MPEPLSPKSGLGMKQAVLPCLLGDVLDDVLVDHHRVGRLDQRVKAVIDFRLAGRGHFVVLPLDLDAQLLHHQAHLGADILLRVGRGDREITFLVADLVAEVGHLVPAGVPDGFLGIDASRRCRCSWSQTARCRR